MKRFSRLSFRWALVALVFALTLALPWAALADNVVNNVVVGGTDTFTLGGSTTVSYKIVATGGDDQPGCNAADGSPATVTINTPAAVTATPASLKLDQCNVPKPVMFTASSAGNYPITVNVSDSGAGSYNVTPAAFTLHVLPPPDNTPPVITPNVSSTLGDNNWYVTDVSVSWHVGDSESAISSTDGCGATIINTDTAGTTLTCSATSAGGTSSSSVTIKRDATPPTVLGAAFPVPNAAGWYNTDVTVLFKCDDNLSGVAFCESDHVLSSEGTSQSVAGNALDSAGNSASTVVGGINIDKTPPEVSITGIANGATYFLGVVPTVGCDTTDTLSGVATHASLGLSGGSTNGVGAFTVACHGATDNAGNPGVHASVVYSVVYNWNGFFRPVDNLPIFNLIKAGSAVPVKFNLGGNQGLSIFTTGFPQSQKIACDTTALLDAVEETVTAGSSSLSYDASSDQYVYVWKTDKSWAGACRQLVVKLNDGTEHLANFKFSK